MNDRLVNLRLTMVEKQIQRRGINDQKTLEIMRKIPRHLFAPITPEKAYEDRPHPIGSGQTISQPYIVAYMTEKLSLEEGERVLEIGTGSGYQTAILAEICAEVYTIEIISSLSIKAQTLLREKLQYGNIHFKIGDGYSGWVEYQPFDRIILTAAPVEIPQILLEQLANDGCLIAPVGEQWQNLILVKRKDDSFEQESLIPVSFVPMVNR